MKVLFSCVLLLALVAASQAYSASLGSYKPTDELLYITRAVFPPKQEIIQKENVNHSSSDFSDQTLVISYINVTDNLLLGSAPRVLIGGPGYPFVTINFKSLLGLGIDSTIQIYGRQNILDS